MGAQGPKSTPFNFLAEETGHARQGIPLDKYSAHQYAMLDAYPGRKDRPAYKDAIDCSTHMHYDDNYQQTPKIQKKNLSAPPSSSIIVGTTQTDTSQWTNLNAQVENTQTTTNPFSFLKYLASWLYYATALRVQNNAGFAAFFLGLVAWPLYRITHLLHVVSALLFAPIIFTLTVSLKVLWVGLPILFKMLWSGFSALCPNIGDIFNPGPKRYQFNEAEKNKAEAQAKEFNRSINRYEITQYVTSGWQKFFKKCTNIVEQSLHCFMPIAELIAPLYKKAKRDPIWYLALVPSVLALAAAGIFADVVLVKVIIELESRGTLRDGFMDQFGGYYAEKGWQHMVEGLVLSWDKMQVGMEFFVYSLVNKAIAPLLELMTLGVPHTSHHTSQFVGTVLLEVMLPMIVMVFAAYKFLKPVVARKAKEAVKAVVEPVPESASINVGGSMNTPRLNAQTQEKSTPTCTPLILSRQQPGSKTQEPHSLIRQIRNLFF